MLKSETNRTTVNSLSPLEVLLAREAHLHPWEKTQSHKSSVITSVFLSEIESPVSTFGPSLPGKPSAPRSPLGPCRDTRSQFRCHTFKNRNKLNLPETFVRFCMWRQEHLPKLMNVNWKCFHHYIYILKMLFIVEITALRDNFTELPFHLTWFIYSVEPQ